MSVAIVRYNAGNALSVQNALRRLNVDSVITDDAEQIRSANKVVFPGVGQAAAAMRSLRASGLDRVLPGLRQPFLGICLGLQLLCCDIEEGDTSGLRIFDVPVKRFPAGSKTPHMGWNTVRSNEEVLFRNVTQESQVYFAHSYYAATGSHTIATTEHALEFSAALRRDHFWAVQFHPEKSGPVGRQILKNFLELA